MSAKIVCAAFGTVMVLAGLVWTAHRWMFPYGYSHCCDIGLKFALDAYADEHGGLYPAGQVTPEASLSLLYPKYTDPEVLRGKTVPLERVQQILAHGQLLDADSCGWHYVEGLTKSDDGRLAIFWDKVGLSHNGQHLWEGGHSVVFLDADCRVVSAEEWPQFLEEQATLLAHRDKEAITGQPALSATIRLPSGEIVDHFEGAWQLETTDEQANGKGFLSGPNLWPKVCTKEGASADTWPATPRERAASGWRWRRVVSRILQKRKPDSSLVVKLFLRPCLVRHRSSLFLRMGSRL
jgi:hypothetical protein